MSFAMPDNGSTESRWCTKPEYHAYHTYTAPRLAAFQRHRSGLRSPYIPPFSSLLTKFSIYDASPTLFRSAPRME